MSEKQQAPAYVQIVKDTAHVVAPKALEITKIFYPKMFSNNPEVYKYFNKTNQRTERQATALADAVIAYAINIDNLGALVDAVKLMAHKHCALGVQAEDYAIVHKNLMEAVGEVLKVDGEIANGWSESVLALASLLIQTEKDLYTAAETRPGGWRGIRMFLVDEVVTEAKDVVSVYFKPKDGGESPEFTAGGILTCTYILLQWGFLEIQTSRVSSVAFMFTSLCRTVHHACGEPLQGQALCPAALHNLLQTLRCCPPPTHHRQAPAGTQPGLRGRHHVLIRQLSQERRRGSSRHRTSMIDLH